MLSFSSTGFCNISGGPSEIPTTLGSCAARLVAQPGWSEGALRQTRRHTTWWYSGSLSDQCSDSPHSCTPTGVSRGTDQLTRNGHGIRWGPRAGPQAGTYPNDWSPPWGSQGASDRETWGLRLKGGIMTDTLLGAPRKGPTVKETWGLREALW